MSKICFVRDELDQEIAKAVTWQIPDFMEIPDSGDLPPVLSEWQSLRKATKSNIISYNADRNSQREFPTIHIFHGNFNLLPKSRLYVEEWIVYASGWFLMPKSTKSVAKKNLLLRGPWSLNSSYKQALLSAYHICLDVDIDQVHKIIPEELAKLEAKSIYQRIQEYNTSYSDSSYQILIGLARYFYALPGWQWQKDRNSVELYSQEFDRQEDKDQLKILKASIGLVLEAGSARYVFEISEETGTIQTSNSGQKTDKISSWKKIEWFPTAYFNAKYVYEQRQKQLETLSA